MISRGRRVPFFGAPDISSADHPWAGHGFEESTPGPGPGPEPLPSHSYSRTTLLHVTGGEAFLNWKHRGVWHKDPCRQGTVSIVRRDVEIQSSGLSKPLPLMVLQLDSSKVQHIAPDHVHAIERSLEAAQVTFDLRLAGLLTAMRAEVRAGCPSGRLYAESISLALLAYLAGTYSTPQPAENCVAILSPVQKRKLVDYVRANVTSNISVSELAGLVQMSPSHFARVFRASFGATPYRFVMRERIEGAKAMLASTKLTASQVATAFGFSSQSHFVKVFRQFAGVTPKQLQGGPVGVGGQK
jgi:AraC family transcriptional regulator